MWRGITHACGHHWHYEHATVRNGPGYAAERLAMLDLELDDCPRCRGAEPPYPFNGTDEQRMRGVPLSLHGADGVSIAWPVKP